MFRSKLTPAVVACTAIIMGFSGGEIVAQDPGIPPPLPQSPYFLAPQQWGSAPGLPEQAQPAQFAQPALSDLPAVPPGMGTNAPPGGAVPAAPAPVQPGATSPAPQPAQPGCECNSVFDWKKVPRTRPMPRPGFFPVPPTGPGYYSVLDWVRGDYLQAPPKYPYPRTSAIFPAFYDLDNFAYLEDPKNTEHDFFDPLKRVHIGDNWLFTTGGEFRTRYMNEDNSRLTRTDNTYQLTRTRVYTDLWYRDDFRIFAEYIGAWSAFQDIAPFGTDQQKSGIQNLFVDMKLADLDGKPAYVRIGRQELLFGSQRLISTLDWVNTRRTFQGVRGFRQTDNWDVDLFWVQPVIPNTGRPSAQSDANKFNSVDNNQNFAGVWLTNRPKAGQVIDLYYLMLDDTNSFTQLGIQQGRFTRHTIGGRYAGNEGNFLFDSESALQFGNQTGRSVFAGMTAQGIGWNFKDAMWNPTVWAYYNYDSGGNPTSGTDHRFNPMFPFGHYYNGAIDLVGNENNHDLNFHLYLYPTKWLTANVQFHNFWLANGKDALYNKGLTAYRFDPTGRSGKHIGEELDFVFNFHLSKHADVLTGYSYLWGGEFLKNTASKTNAVDSGLYYLQFSYKW